MDEKGLVFTVTRKVRDEERTYTVNILDGFCSCYSFVQNKVPCVDMYAVFTHVNMGCDVPFSLLPSSVLDSTVMRIQSTIDDSGDNTSTFDLPPAIDLSSISTSIMPSPLVDPPIPESQQKRARKYKQSLIEAAKHALDLAYSLDFDDVEAIFGDSSDPLQLVKAAQAAMLKHKPLSADGLTIFQPICHRGTRKVNKRMVMDSVQNLTAPSAKRRRVSLPTKSTIPNKIRFRKPIAPNVPYDVFIANEQQQRDAEHMKFDSADDIDMNDTISYNYQNTRTSSRAIRPSAAMLESMKYQKRMNGQPQ
eukprot:303497_1